MTSMETTLINVAYIFGIIIFIFVWLLFLRAKYAKAVVGKVLGEFITEEGNSYTKLLPVVGGFITIPPTRKLPEGRMYAVADVSVYTCDYPAVPRFLSIIQTKAKKALFDEACWEPLTNRSGKLLLSPRRLYNLLNQQFTGIAQVQAREEGIAKGIVPKTRINSTTLIWIVGGIFAIAIIAAGIYFLKSNGNAIPTLAP